MVEVWLKVKDAAGHLRVSEAMVRRLLRERRLVGYKAGRCWMVSFNHQRRPGGRGPKPRMERV